MDDIFKTEILKMKLFTKNLKNKTFSRTESL